MMDQIFQRLLTTAGPSGFEGALQEVYKEQMAPYVDSIETDNMGNVIAVKRGPEGSPKVMLTAHCDEIGFLVSNIDDNGFLYMQEIGGIDTDLLPGRKVEIHTAKGVVNGIFGKKAIHLTKGEEKKKLGIEDVWLDIAARYICFIGGSNGNFVDNDPNRLDYQYLKMDPISPNSDPAVIELNHFRAQGCTISFTIQQDIIQYPYGMAFQDVVANHPHLANIFAQYSQCLKDLYYRVNNAVEDALTC